MSGSGTDGTGSDSTGTDGTGTGPERDDAQSASLAPVTYLFGAGRGSAKPSGSAAAAGTAGDDGGDGWYQDDADADTSVPIEAAVPAETAGPVVRTEPAVRPVAQLSAVPSFAMFDRDAAATSVAPAEADEDADASAEDAPAPPVRSKVRFVAAREDADDEDPDAPRDEAAELDRAHNIGLHGLAKKGMSVVEMAKLLASRDLAPEIVEAEVARFEAVGLLDDAALAETLVRTLQERKGLGRSGVVGELRRRGLDAIAIDTAMEALDGDEEQDRATELARKRAPQLRNLDHETAKRRLSGFLMRRGYSGSVVQAAVAASLEAPSRGPRFR